MSNQPDENQTLPDEELDGLLETDDLNDVPEPMNESGQDPEAEEDSDADEAGTS